MSYLKAITCALLIFASLVVANFLPVKNIKAQRDSKGDTAQLKSKTGTTEFNIWTLSTASECPRYYAKGGSVYLSTTNKKVADIKNGDIYVICQDSNLIFAKNNIEVFRGNDPITPLSDIDAPSFEPVGTDGHYGKDRYHGYWFTSEDWGIIPQADSESFTTSNSLLPFARDSTHIFYLAKVIEAAELASFHSIPNSRFATDANHVYAVFGHLGDVQILAGADPGSFRAFPATIKNGTIMDSDYGKDFHAIYCNNSELPDADLDTFAPIDQITARDKYGMFIACNRYNSNNSAF